MKEKTQISILVSVALFFAVLILAYTAFFSSPISIYDVTVVKESSSVGFEQGGEEEEELPEIVSESEEAETDRADKEKININTASDMELMKLKGIGEVIAVRIIQYREENGSFTSIDEIKNVAGIGEKIFDSIMNDITVE